jgi:hypothetical protein
MWQSRLSSDKHVFVKVENALMLPRIFPFFASPVNVTLFAKAATREKKLCTLVTRHNEDLRAVNAFYCLDQRQFYCLNAALLTLIPKKPVKPSDYRASPN